jgi:hypothetical protein
MTWDCDEMTNRLSTRLRRLGIPHQTVLGHSDEGSSHTWVRIGTRNLDPTRQGFGDGMYEVIETHN